MADEKKVEENKDVKAVEQARTDEKLDLLLKGVADAVSRVDAACARMDALERANKARQDAEEGKEGEGKEFTEKDKPPRLVADKACKDEDEKPADKDEGAKDEKAKADGGEEKEPEVKEEARKDARADAIVNDLRSLIERQSQQIAELSTRVPRPVSDDEWSTLVGLQSRADDALVPLGKRAPRPFNGETPVAYRRRVAEMLRPYSSRWKAIPVNSITDAAFESVVEGQIYADAAVSARTPTDLDGGRIRAVQKHSTSGHQVTEFVGSAHFVKQLARPRRIAHIRDPQSFTR